MKRTELRRSTKPMKRTALRAKRAPLRAKGSKYARRPDTGEPGWEDAKAKVRHRSGGHCEGRTPVCQGRAATVHHRKLRKQGGTHHPYNLLDLCSPCHRFVHAEPAYSYRRGLLVRSHEDPQTVPVVVGGGQV